jgi:hypothetical protein
VFDLVNGCNSPRIKTACIRRASNTGPWQKEQRADSDIDGQLKVGPIYRESFGAPATKGES